MAEFRRKGESEYVKIVQQTQEKDWDVHNAEERKTSSGEGSLGGGCLLGRWGFIGGGGTVRGKERSSRGKI